MTATDILVEVTRAGRVESRHFGSIAFADPSGGLLGIVGDRQRTVFPRSAIKIVQALPLVESGAADHFRLSPMELAFTCGSHNGTPQHVAMAKAVLRRIGLNNCALACGADMPLDILAQHGLIRAGQTLSPLHHNCSGKHIGMLATALHAGDTIDGYELAHHDVQHRIRSTIADVTDTDLSGIIPGVDGCSVPNWPLPLENLAIAFARITSGTGFNASRQGAFERLLSACWQYPEAMAGTGRLDTITLQRFKGDVFVKGGAEGVYCGGFRNCGVGFALKIDDGAQRASETAVRAIIARFAKDAENLADPIVLQNTNGIAVGDIRPSSALMNLLENIQL